ncbi:MAG: hypothetical protein ACI4C1_10125 [Lachnospiraceae bacterium]
MGKKIGIFAAVLLLIEIFVFNYQHWRSVTYEEIILETKIEDNTIYCIVPEIHLSNLKIEIETLRQEDYLNVTIYADDEANALLFSLGTRKLSYAEQSHIVTLHLAGISSQLKLEVDLAQKDAIETCQVTANVVVPFSFSWIRVLFLLLIGILWILLTDMPIGLTIPYGEYISQDKTAAQARLVTIILVASCALIVGSCSCSNLYRYSTQRHHHQYQELARSLCRGELFIDDEPNPVLESMQNPYDTNLRKQLMKESNQSYRWDTAYFEGKYYVYFGIVPVFLFYLPYYILTGTDLLNTIAIAMAAILWVISSFLLWNTIVKRWFTQLSLLHFYVLYLLLLISGFVPLLLDIASFYVLPVVTGIAFANFGMFFWIDSLPKEKDSKQGLSLWKLSLGSLCIALVAGCRPQLLCIALAGIPLFWDYLKKKQPLKIYCAAFVPILLVAISIMYYNYARFHNPFDFGSNYNLTTNDLTHRTFDIGRIGLGLFAYLFQTPAINAQLPFLQSVNLKNQYFGLTYTESMYGGVFWLSPILWLAWLSIGPSKKPPAFLPSQEIIRHLSVIYLISAVVIVIADTQMGGLCYRYIGDFAWMLATAALLVLGHILTNSALSNVSKNRLLRLLVLLQIVSLIMTLSVGDTSSSLMYTIAFWM